MTLATANGIIVNTKVAESSISALGDDIQVRVLKSTPRVLSVHKIVQEGGSFTWDERGARLEYKGRIHDLPIQRGVPLLALPATEVSDKDKK